MPKFILTSHRISRIRRLVLALGSAAAFAATTHAADYYVTPNGAGAKTGADWANADEFSSAGISTIANDLSAGDTLYFGSGTYHTGSGPIITISSSGTSGNPKSIVGVDTGSGLPLFSGTYDVDDSGVSTDTFLSFSGSTAHWVFQDLNLEEYAFAVRMDASGSSYTLRNNMTFDNIDGENVQDFFQLRNASHIVVENCDVIRYTKRGFRYGQYTSYLTFDTCTADANGDDDNFPTKSIPAGFKGDDTNYNPDIHDITFVDCVARNNRYAQSPGNYWNGDGFASEEATYNLSYTRCFSYNNHDAGWDDKADNATYVGCVSIGSSEGFRYWGNNGVFINCLAAYNKIYGGTNTGIGFWVGKQAQGNIGYSYIYFSTAHNNDEWQVRAFNGGQMVVTDSILSVDGTFTDGGMEQEKNGGSVTLVDVAKFKASANLFPDPDYVAPSATWDGTPANAFDSDEYAPDKGYYSAASLTAIANISVSDSSAGEPSDDGEFTVSIAPAPSSPVTVNLSVSGSATAGSDYASLSSTVVVGTSGTATIALDVTDDGTVESDETVAVTLASGTGYIVGSPSSATITIMDDDAVTPSVTVAVQDGDAGEPYNDGEFRLTAVPSPSSPIQISLSTSGTATAGIDYTAIGSTVTMGTSGTVDVQLDMKNDSNTEGDETVILTANSGTGYVVGTPASATITIEDDDAIPVVDASVVDSSFKEPGNNGKFKLKATPSPGSSITVNISVSGTATEGVDYEDLDSSYSVPGGGTKTFLIKPIDDSLVEGDESVTVTVLPGTGYTVGTSATITLQDND